MKKTAICLFLLLFAFSLTLAGAAQDSSQPLSPSFVFIAGLIAGFNPCLLAILAFMVSILLNTGGRMRALYTTFAFSLGVFVVYLVVGIGLFRALACSPIELQEVLKLLLITIIFLLGLWQLYDSYYISRKAESSFTTPRQIVELAQRVGEKASYPSAFLLGALFSLVKAPCVCPLYFVILNLLMAEGTLSQGLFHLAIYNLGLVLPIVVLGCAMALGLSPEKVDRFRKEKKGFNQINYRCYPDCPRSAPRAEPDIILANFFLLQCLLYRKGHDWLFFNQSLGSVVEDDQHQASEEDVLQLGGFEG